MALPALVLVHGGGLAAQSWELTAEEIHRLAPDLTVLALDMPVRRNKPGDLRAMGIGDYVDSLVDDIESAGLDDIVIVGHSMGAITLPGVVTKLGAAPARRQPSPPQVRRPSSTAAAEIQSKPLIPLHHKLIRRSGVVVC
jgi:pimeloyl-ACP methyl ester carboxylesterase